MAVLAWRSRGIDLALLLSVCGALITPMFWNAATGQRQPEVAVIARSAKQLVNDHSPYQSVASLATVHDPNAYNPYLPVMALFGVPRALFGSHVITDPRVWFGVAFLVIFWLALQGGRGPELRSLDGVHRGVAGDRVRARRRRHRCAHPGPDVPRFRAAVAAAPVRAGRDRARPGVGGQGHGLAGRDRRGGADRHAGRQAAGAGLPGLGGGLVRGDRRAGRGTLAGRPGRQHDPVPARAWPMSSRPRPARCPVTCSPTPGISVT